MDITARLSGMPYGVLFARFLLLSSIVLKQLYSILHVCPCALSEELHVFQEGRFLKVGRSNRKGFSAIGKAPLQTVVANN